MQIGSTMNIAPAPQVSVSEPAERGPDRDNDGDEGGKTASVAKALPAPPPGRGGAVDMLA